VEMPLLNYIIDLKEHDVNMLEIKQLEDSHWASK
jgi:hypothetical protein